MSKVYRITKTQVIPAPVEAVWDFFASPSNLKKITPPELDFHLLPGTSGRPMYPGQILEYTVRPLLGIPFYWMTEITEVVPLRYFIDEQRFGPYSFWHHQHHFRETGQGVEMTDIIHYRIPLWFLGDLAHGLFVGRQLEKIFSYRSKVTETIFKPASPEHETSR